MARPSRAYRKEFTHRPARLSWFMPIPQASGHALRGGLPTVCTQYIHTVSSKHHPLQLTIFSLNKRRELPARHQSSPGPRPAAAETSPRPGCGSGLRSGRSRVTGTPSSRTTTPSIWPKDWTSRLPWMPSTWHPSPPSRCLLSWRVASASSLPGGQWKTGLPQALRRPPTGCRGHPSRNCEIRERPHALRDRTA